MLELSSPMLFSKYFIGATIAMMVMGCVATVYGDGMPYSGVNAKYRALRFEYMSLQMSDAQMEQAASTGVITFTPSQLKKLRLHYPKFPIKAGLCSSTHNDGIEPEGPEAYVIWWHADEVVVTFDEQSSGREVSMPSDKPVSDPESTLFRFSPDGRIYHKAKAVSLKTAFEVIDGLAEAIAHGKKEEVPYGIVIPPPPRHEVDLHESVRHSLPVILDDGETYKTVLKIAEAVRVYAGSKGISLFNSW